QNYPNPFNPTTTIVFTLPQASAVNLSVYDIRGRLVAMLLDDWLQAGEHALVWNASHLTSGTYLIRLKSDDQCKVIKAVLAR
ncbi:T9SS type A sorting domain-containing protein, partial [candidate division KSB1 bacterium]|nr:T9SS type A sorting domain-containing protein [candidate division KSB1 bacterium]